MKTNYLLSSLLFFFFLSFAACSDDKDPVDPPGPGLAEGITLTPESLDDTAEAKITFKAPKSSALYGYVGDVYAHIGVVEGSDWLYVPAQWDENLAKCKMTKEEDNVWSLTLSSSIRSWFGVTGVMPIQKIGLVVRSADGKKQEADAFISVTDKTFNPGVIENAAIPSNMKEGINIVSASTVTLVLYDKDKNGNRKDYAYVIGDFNNWIIDNAYQMKRDEAAGCWWLTIDGLNGQTEYAFQYYIGTKTDGNICLADAYTEKVLDPAHDMYIPASTYPGLREYPSDKTAGIISTFKTQPDAYSWQVTDFKVEDTSNLVIYEMLFRDFTESGNINGAMDKLDYLKDMGVNTIELMPVQEFDGNDSWGYNPCFYFAMDKAYGTKNDYKAFIDACHQRGIAVLLDVVYNHATGANPFAKLYWNQAANKTASNNPWFNVDEPHPYGVFHDFNHESELVKAFVKRNLQFLLTEYKIDGFRFDMTKGFTQKASTEDTAGNYDQNRIDILKDYNQAIITVNPDAVVILEHFAVVSEETELAKAGMQLWRNANHAYCQTAMGYSGESAFTPLTTDGTTMPFGGWVSYMESHDEERAAYKQTQWGSIGALKTDLATRMKQLEVNASLFFTIPGPKMIWQFGELGYDISIEENGRTGKKPVKWEYYSNDLRKGLHDTYSKLIVLRESHKELFRSTTTMNWKVGVSNWENGRYISLRTLTGQGLVAVGNFTDQTITCSVDFQQTGTWEDYINGGDDVVVSSETQDISVPAHSFIVYLKK